MHDNRKHLMVFERNQQMHMVNGHFKLSNLDEVLVATACIVAITNSAISGLSSAPFRNLVLNQTWKCFTGSHPNTRSSSPAR
jgi:hypothetical protein